MNERLIFDVGMHKCEDIDFYLNKGYKVVGIEANPYLTEKAKIKYKKFIDTNMLIVLNFAISDIDDSQINFYISKKTELSSLKPNKINDLIKEKVLIKTSKLSTLFEKYGIPYYCKIDIEGADNIALNTLSTLEECPQYISVESEYVEDRKTFKKEDSLQILHTLYSLGYRYFKLVDQDSFVVLDSKNRHYKEPNQFFYMLFNKLNTPIGNKYRISKKFNYKFKGMASGPFGEYLEKDWMTFEEASFTLLKHREAFYNLIPSIFFDFCCNLHAKKNY